MSDKYAALLVIAGSTKRAMIEAGASQEQAEEAYRVIERVAGSMLPPVNGTFNGKLDDTRMN